MITSSVAHRLHIFCDFDGTLALHDLGDEVFIRFAGYPAFAQYQDKLKNNILDVKSYWRELCALLPPMLTHDEIVTFALQHRIDPTIHTLLSWCNELHLPFTIVSDGFSDYIAPLLAREHINVPVFSNHLVYEGTHIRPIFPYSDESCSCFCASCKRNTVLRSAHPEALIVYIGDGYSDFCSAEHADIIFAKKSLAAYCNKYHIPHYQFSNFADIRRILAKEYAKPRLKPRRQAQLKRMEAFMCE
jgi:2-hydroxy-3-keto-5-methylthiopentenyl-1-phosphate phosphatase